MAGKLIQIVQLELAFLSKQDLFYFFVHFINRQIEKISNVFTLTVYIRFYNMEKPTLEYNIIVKNRFNKTVTPYIK